MDEQNIARPHFYILNESQREQIHRDSLHILSSIGIRWITGKGHNLISGDRGLRVQSVFSVERQRTRGPYVRCAQYYACLHAHLGRDICVLTSARLIHRKIPPAHTYASTASSLSHFLFGKLGAATPDILRHPPHWGSIRLWMLMRPNRHRHSIDFATRP